MIKSHFLVTSVVSTGQTHNFGNLIIIIILFISYITVQQQDEVCKRNTQKIQSCSDQQFNYMVVKYITMSLASHCCIVQHVIVLSLILMHSAIILACMASSVLMVFL